jgi:CheY-like chemotaxis protein
MAKIMLVEDDNNLREIYEARLLAEGYEIVAAKDGEEALAMAVKEKPDLIIADIMMPKISGFDMLDILRTTPEIKDTKVIVMTALSQAEDKARADKLGADRYLVKSQVTLEDDAKTAREVLEGTAPGGTPAPAAPAAPNTTAPEPPAPAPQATPPADPPATPAAGPGSASAGPTSDDQPATPIDPPADPPANAPVDVPAADPVPTPIPVSTPPTDPTASTGLAEPTKQEAAEVSQQIQNFSDSPSKEVVAPPEQKTVELSTTHERVIQPLNDLPTKPDLNELLAKEEAKAQADQPAAPPAADTVVPAGTPTPADESPSEVHAPGQVIGPDTTPGTDPNNPHDVAL